MEVPDILRSAAAHVRHGWTRGIRHDPRTLEVCALGALENAIAGRRLTSIYDVGSFTPQMRPAVFALATLLPSDRWSSPYSDIAEWNNDPTQTAENVAATLELAAIVYEHEHEHQPTPVQV